MIRKAIRKATIVSLSLAAIATAGVGWCSYTRTFRFDIRITNRDWLYFHFNDGFARLFWFRSKQEISFEVGPSSGPYDSSRVGPPAPPGYKVAKERLTITASGCGFPVSTTIASSETLRSSGLPVHQVSWFYKLQSISGCPLVYQSFVRTRSWVVGTVFAAWPVIAFISGPLRRWRRRRKPMIRKAIIVVLTLCALVVLLLGWTGRNDMSMLNDSFDFAGWHLNIEWDVPLSREVSRRWAFGGVVYHFWAPGGVTFIHIPVWILVALFAAYPTIAVIRSPARRRRSRMKRGLCLKCGYDLTGNESGVCPECGTKI